MAKTKKIILPKFVPNTIRMYLDGSAIHYRADIRRVGGWGLYLTGENIEDKGFKGGEHNTTVSRMEMTAMLFALNLSLEYFNNGDYCGQPIKIYSDSQMVVRSINLRWLNNWVREKFIGRINSDIWIKIWEALVKLNKSKVDYEIIHMSGHQKNLDNPHVLGNNIADLLADYKQHL